MTEAGLEQARHRRCGAAAAAQADDRDRGHPEPRADPLGDRHRLRRDEAHRRPHRRRNDYIHHPRPDSCSGILPAHQAQGFASGGES